MNRWRSSRACSTGHDSAPISVSSSFGDHLRDACGDLGVLLAEAPHVAREPGRPLEDLVVEAVGLLGDDDVLLERGADLVHLLDDDGRPVLDPPGRRRGQRLLQVHERIVQRLAALTGLLQRRGEVALPIHGRHGTGGDTLRANGR